MKTRWAISLIVLGAVILVPQAALADDLADLKATHQRYGQAWNTGDLKTVFEIWQDGGIWVPTNRAVPVVTNSAAGMQMFTRFFETHIYRSVWNTIDYRVIGNTGLIWGLRTVTVMSKTKGIGKRYFFKSTMVYVKTDGKWQGVMFHDSPIPSEADLF
jgi:uncharacterized protein (TIGR02246 family)